jgi:two-component system cell cycle response regulator DivK
MMTRTVLIIEDYEKSLKLFKLIVTSMGHDVVTASDSHEGVRLAKQIVPDLILMDIQMPRMNGIEAMQLLKADPKTARVPVIALTSYVMKGDRERLLSEGFTHYIAKPIDKKSFMADVERILDGDRGKKA